MFHVIKRGHLIGFWYQLGCSMGSRTAWSLPWQLGGNSQKRRLSWASSSPCLLRLLHVFSDLSMWSLQQAKQTWQLRAPRGRVEAVNPFNGWPQTDIVLLQLYPIDQSSHDLERGVNKPHFSIGVQKICRNLLSASPSFLSLMRSLILVAKGNSKLRAQIPDNAEQLHFPVYLVLKTDGNS